MLHYHEVKKHPKVLKAMTSLNEEEFNKLCESFEEAWNESTDSRDPSTGGRPEKLLLIEDKLLFILFYLKTYPLQEVLGYLFSMTQSQANEWIYRLTQILQKALQKQNALPARKPEYFFDLISEEGSQSLALDGTERRIQRPQTAVGQKIYYSGKKKTHTIKNNLIVGVSDRIIKYLSKTCEGKKSDITLIKEEKIDYPKGVNLYQDKGFQGYHPKGVCIYQPEKKPKGQVLTDKQINKNRLISSVRIVVEHVISGIKRLRICKDVYRNLTDGYDDQVMLVSCGLYNFRSFLRFNTY